MEVTLTAGEALELLDRIRSVNAASNKVLYGAEGSREVVRTAARAASSSVFLTLALRRAGIETPLVGTEAAL